MVAVIHTDRPTAKSVLDYNYKKVNHGHATVIGMYNIDEQDQDSVYDLFDIYSIRNRGTTNFSFQMSINPNPDKPEEQLTHDEAKAFAKELMDALGYGDQPIIIYEHADIGRGHYHVVSCRTNWNGKKINDYREQYVLKKAMSRLQNKYHYTIGNTAENKKLNKGIMNLPKFDRTKDNVAEQINNLFDLACSYRFTTFTQFATILKGMGVEVETITSKEGEPIIAFRGSNNKKDKNGFGGITEATLNRKCYSEFLRAAQYWIDNSTMSAQQREQAKKNRYKTYKTVEDILDLAKTQKHFERMLAKKGITCELSRNDYGELFGATFVDHKNKIAYKASDLSRTAFTTSIMQEKDEKWKETEAELREAWVERKKEERDAYKRKVIGIMTYDRYKATLVEPPSLIQELRSLAKNVAEEMFQRNELKGQKAKKPITPPSQVPNTEAQQQTKKEQSNKI